MKKGLSSNEPEAKTSEELPIPKTPFNSPELEEEDDLGLGAAVAGFSSWFSSTITSAKEKSNEMLQYLKQDFTEFSETVKEASTTLNEKLKLEDTAKSAVQTVTNTATTVLDQMSTIFGVGPDDDDEAIVMNEGGPVIVDRVKVSFCQV